MTRFDRIIYILSKVEETNALKNKCAVYVFISFRTGKKAFLWHIGSYTMVVVCYK